MPKVLVTGFSPIVTHGKIRHSHNRNSHSRLTKMHILKMQFGQKTPTAIDIIILVVEPISLKIPLTLGKMEFAL